MGITVKQMLPAEAGMYLVYGREATLVVMWALLEDEAHNQKIVGLTITDMQVADFTLMIAERFNTPETYSSRVNDRSHNVTR